MGLLLVRDRHHQQEDISMFQKHNKTPYDWKEGIRKAIADVRNAGIGIRQIANELESHVDDLCQRFAMSAPHDHSLP
jgi:hypothetical protein